MGLVRVQDAASELIVATIDNSFPRDIEVGNRGVGTLEVLGGTVEALDMEVGSLSPNVIQGDGTVLVDGGAINLSGYLIAGSSGPAAIDIDSGSLTVASEALLYPGAVVTVDGGSLEVGTLTDFGGRLVFSEGELTVTNPSQNLLVGPLGLTIGTFAIETDNSSPGRISSTETYTVAGDLFVATGATLHTTSGLGNPGVEGRGLTIATGGTVINSSGDRTIRTNGPLQMAIGSKLEMLGSTAQQFGDASAFNGVVVAGHLILGFNQVLTLLDANDVVFDSGALVESPGDTLSEMIVANGLTIDFGATVTGELIITSPDDPTKPVINNGSIVGESLSAPITLTGYVKGVGTCDNCVITGTDAPGFSPATVVRGSVAYRGVLEIEIGGTGSGDYDRLEHLLGAGVADLGGELEIVLIDGYELAAGDQIEFLTASGVTGSFDTETLPTLGGGLDTQLIYGADSVTLAVVGIEGDYNYDGVVDAADYTVWRDALGQTGVGLAADGDNNGVIEQADYDIWQTNYGATAVALAVAVPEPGGLALLAVAGLILPRRAGRLPEVFS